MLNGRRGSRGLKPQLSTWELQAAEYRVITDGMEYFKQPCPSYVTLKIKVMYSIPLYTIPYIAGFNNLTMVAVRSSGFWNLTNT
jgi:hypothetical protein